MKYVFALLIVFSIIGCRSKKECCQSESKVVQVVDSTNVPGYNQSQRALAIYILSLSEKERQEWIRGTFTEEEMNSFLDSLEIKITDPE